MKKSLEEYSLKDFWIRFLANYEEDKKSGMLEELCKLEEGIKMAESETDAEFSKIDDEAFKRDAMSWLITPSKVISAGNVPNKSSVLSVPFVFIGTSRASHGEIASI